MVALAGCGRINFEDGDATSPCTEPWSAPRPVDTTDTSVVARSGPTITSDELELYFAQDSDLYVMRRTSAAAPFGPAVLVSPPSTPEVDSFPSISNDGLDLYFTHNFMGNAFIEHAHRASRAAAFEPSTQSGLYGDGDVSADQLEFYVSDFQTPISVRSRSSVSDSFGPAVDLDPLINDGSMNYSVSISSDGLELYFNSTREGPIGIYGARRDTRRAAFSQVDRIEAGPDVREPEISADGRHLYFIEISTGSTLSVISRCDD